MWKIPKQYSHFVYGAIQSGVTCAVASAIASMQFVAEGTFMSHWLRSYFFSWVAMLPVVVVAAPSIRWLANRITREC
ncbi:hypothetical protein A6V36_13875 [Paraburkholderia ginsengiterrae]|uniref:GNAT family acetyltransferase n=2 Tax=Paraburkholderia ginsengiterrae TaxID=1462993 RepID=A0A1A9MXE2_9BURK|nr:DUF2798 domain-containing protein [Paraburkholderia ginsengiterrae]OAJ52597.1 hypothetical protein A6V36_13875 [Paraburkholderia ginsengiterrae]OAJ52793.1 hypothetical protein A6V37_09325 [Paraburkholderia ginsengiterrae]